MNGCNHKWAKGEPDDRYPGDYFKRCGLCGLDERAPAVQAGDGEAPAVLTYEPERRSTVTLRWPDGNIAVYDRATQPREQFAPSPHGAIGHIGATQHGPAPREQAGAGAVACHHEAYQGACIHCGVPIKNGRAAPCPRAEGVDEAMVERACEADWGQVEWAEAGDNKRAVERSIMRQILAAALGATP